jgi:hypothetical protein
MIKASVSILQARQIVVFCALLVIFACQANRPNHDGSKFREIERLWQMIPTYSGLVEVDGSSLSKDSEARLSKEYKSNAPFDDVKRFYLEKLGEKGWQFIEESELKDRGRLRGERLLEFRQGEYNLSVRYAGERDRELGYDYLITVGWHNY